MSQFTSEDLTGLILRERVGIRMDGKEGYTGPDYIGMERLWRDEKVYSNGPEAKAGLDDYFRCCQQSMVTA